MVSPKFQKSSDIFLLCGKTGSTYVTSPKDIIMFGGELIDKPPLRFFSLEATAALCSQQVVGSSDRRIEKEEDSSLCVREREEMSTEFGTGRMNHKKVF